MFLKNPLRTITNESKRKHIYMDTGCTEKVVVKQLWRSSLGASHSENSKIVNNSCIKIQCSRHFMEHNDMKITAKIIF